MHTTIKLYFSYWFIIFMGGACNGLAFVYEGKSRIDSIGLENASNHKYDPDFSDLQVYAKNSSKGNPSNSELDYNKNNQNYNLNRINLEVKSEILDMYRESVLSKPKDEVDTDDSDNEDHVPEAKSFAENKLKEYISTSKKIENDGGSKESRQYWTKNRGSLIKEDSSMTIKTTDDQNTKSVSPTTVKNITSTNNHSIKIDSKSVQSSDDKTQAPANSEKQNITNTSILAQNSTSNIPADSFSQVPNKQQNGTDNSLNNKNPKEALDVFTLDDDAPLLNLFDEDYKIVKDDENLIGNLFEEDQAPENNNLDISLESDMNVEDSSDDGDNRNILELFGEDFEESEIVNENRGEENFAIDEVVDALEGFDENEIGPADPDNFLDVDNDRIDEEYGSELLSESDSNYDEESIDEILLDNDNFNQPYVNQFIAEEIEDEQAFNMNNIEIPALGLAENNNNTKKIQSERMIKMKKKQVNEYLNNSIASLNSSISSKTKSVAGSKKDIYKTDKDIKAAKEQCLAKMRIIKEHSILVNAKNALKNTKKNEVTLNKNLAELNAKELKIQLQQIVHTINEEKNQKTIPFSPVKKKTRPATDRETV